MSFEELDPSVLGNKSFWDEQYELELENFKDHGDLGEIWFGKNIMKKMIQWTSENIDKESSIIDLGCGNGILLIELAKLGYRQLTGVDYSAAAVNLASVIAESFKADIIYEACDMLCNLQTAEEKVLKRKYNLLVDKGTYDTISLMQEDSLAKREQYLHNCQEILEESGLFLLATCNWTEDEITQQAAKYYEFVQVLPTPVMQFGGKKGRNVTIAIFRKK